MINLGMILQTYSGLKDGSVKLVFETLEAGIIKDQLTELLTLQGKYLQIAIIEQEQEIEEKQIPVLPEPTIALPKPKSNSQMIRDHLYILWEKKKPGMSFDSYYDKYAKYQRDSLQKEIDKYD